MANNYRDELGAAQARIAELEQQVAFLEARVAAPATEVPIDGAFPELEGRVAAARAGVARSDRLIKLGTLEIYFGLALILGGLVASLLHAPLVSTAASFAFIVVTIHRILVVPRNHKAMTKAVRDAEERLVEARRVRGLERKVAELEAGTRPVRVDVSPPAAEELSPDSERPTATVGRS